MTWVIAGLIMLWRTNGLAEMGRNWGTLGEGGWATLDSFEKMRTCML